MIRWNALGLGVAALAMASVTSVPLLPTHRGVTSVSPAPPSGVSAAPDFDPAKSAGLFVGVRKFQHDQTLEVPYAVDDAVDMAYEFVVERRMHPIPPKRAVLAIGGKPRSDEARKRLDELRRRGVREANTDPGTILKLLREQAEAAGQDGLLVVSIATHGVVREGVQYILGSSSLFRDTDTAVSMAKLFDVAAQSTARSLFFVDACRERIDGTTRGSTADPRTAAPLISRVRNLHGQVIFLAAPAGGYAYDDDASQNGAFTKAVLDGLRCGASSPRGTVTVESLHTYVNRAVGAWVRRNRDPSLGAATQVSFEGKLKNMPLAFCWLPPAPRPLLKTKTDGTFVTALSDDGSELWRKDLRGPVLDAQVADLDGDGHQEVVAGTADGIVTFDRAGERVRTIAEGPRLRKFVISDLYRKRLAQQIVALWADDGASTSRLTIHDDRGALASSYDHPRVLRQLIVDRPTNRHAWKLVVADGSSVMLFNPRHLERGKPEWTHTLSEGERIDGIRIIDHDRDARRDIALSLDRARTCVIDFDDGKTLPR